MPCVLTLLTDRSKRNRWAAAWYLSHVGDGPKHIPLKCIARAVAQETTPGARQEMIRLMAAVLDAQDGAKDKK